MQDRPLSGCEVGRFHSQALVLVPSGIGAIVRWSGQRGFIKDETGGCEGQQQDGTYEVGLGGRCELLLGVLADGSI